MIYIGTSGFSYADWKGKYYPERIKDRDMLVHYAGEFRVVELDFTYYQMPGLRTMIGLERKTPDGFRFCVKANRAMTHEPSGDAAERRQVFGAFRSSLQPVIQAGKFGCLLVQFPWSYRASPENCAYLSEIREHLADLPVVVEFRSNTWADAGALETTLALLRGLGMGFCCVDEPRLKGLMPPVAVATSPVGYVRFHGRNAAKWWKHQEAWERYSYLYNDRELGEWLPRIRDIEGQTEVTYVLFNNHRDAQAVQNARLMQSMLEVGGAERTPARMLQSVLEIDGS